MKSLITKTLLRLSLLIIIASFISNSTEAQSALINDSLYKAGVENSGRLWGYAFGDFAYKSHADSLTRGEVTSIQEFGRKRPCSSFAVFIWAMIIISLKNSPPNFYLLRKIIFLRVHHR